MRAKIAEPGVYHGLPIDEYHGDCCAGPSVSSSGLRTIFLESPAHYWVDSYLNANRRARKETAPLVLGRAAHHLLLGEDHFTTLFVARPPRFDSWRTDAAKDWRSQQEAAGRTVLLPSDLEVIRGMARSLSSHPLVEAGILNGQIEQSILWQDEATGVWLKARPDAIPTYSGDFADLKTTVNFGFDLDRDVSKYRYDMQAALVGMGLRAVRGREMESFSFVFVGKEPPCSVEVLTLSKEDIASAQSDLRAAIDTFAWCLKTGTWFGPGGTQQDARYVHVSEWARKDAEFRRDFLRREIAPPQSAPATSEGVFA